MVILRKKFFIQCLFEYVVYKSKVIFFFSGKIIKIQDASASWKNIFM